MIDDLTVAKIILSILNNSAINSEIVERHISEDLNISDKIALLNAIIISHKKRYQSCFSDDQRLKEIEYLKLDCKTIFKQNLNGFVSDSLAVIILLFITAENLRSSSFREICVSLGEELKSCECNEIKNAMYEKLTHCIIRGFLYGEEPFDSLLDQSVKYFDNHKSVVLSEDIMFLE